MRILVIGASGRTGRLVVDEAVRRGHDVTALARDVSRLGELPQGVAVVQGDAAEVDSVQGAAAGHDAAVTALSPGRTPGGVTAMLGAVTEGLSAAGVARLVVTSAYGPVATRPYVTASLVRMLLRRTFADQLQADAVVRSSGLEWTIVRATRLTGAATRRPPRLTPELLVRGPYSLGRPAFASVLVDLAVRREYVGETVNLGGG